MTVYLVGDVGKGVAKHGLLVVLIYFIFVAEHGKGVAAVMGSVLLDFQGFQSIIHVFAEILDTIRQVSTMSVQPFADKRQDGAVDRYDPVLPGSSLNSALEVFFFEIRLHVQVCRDPETGIAHD